MAGRRRRGYTLDTVAWIVYWLAWWLVPPLRWLLRRLDRERGF